MDQIDALNKAVDYIETHLADDIDMARPARIAGCAPGSFARLFSLLAGLPLGEYIRRRRLTRAGYEVRSADARVLDIALRWGYDSADAFTRAFARQHGATPTQVRRDGAPLHPFLPLSFHLTAKGAKDMVFAVENKPEMVLRGVWTEMSCAPEARFAREHELWAAECEDLPGRVSACGIPGVWFGVYHNGRYAVARNACDTARDDTQIAVIPAGKYAVFTSENGGFAGEILPKMREEIFQKALGDAGYAPVSDLEIEVYHLFSRGEKEKRYYEYWVPVALNVTSS